MVLACELENGRVCCVAPAETAEPIWNMMSYANVALVVILAHDLWIVTVLPRAVRFAEDKPDQIAERVSTLALVEAFFRPLMFAAYLDPHPLTKQILGAVLPAVVVGSTPAFVEPCTAVEASVSAYYCNSGH